MTIVKIDSTQPPNVLEIRWAMNNVCNFKCHYCFPGSNEGNFRSPADLKLIIENFKHLLDCYKQDLKKDKFHLMILGGEPTMWKDLAEFIREIKLHHNIYVSIISNGSRTLRWWKENGDLIDNLVLSFHQSFSNIDHTIEVADIMYDFGKKVTIHVLMDHTQWDSCVNSINYMLNNSKRHWMIQAKEVVSTENHTVSYTLEQRKFLQKELKRFPTVSWLIKNLKLLINKTVRMYESVCYTDSGKKTRSSAAYYISTEQNAFKGWKCNIGLESVYIDYTGELAGSCGQSIFNNSNYNILYSNFVDIFKIKKVPVVCQLDKCWCPADTHVSKIKFIPIKVN